MAKKQKNLPEVVPELFEHEEFGKLRYIKRGDEIWFMAVDVCRALDIQNTTQAVAKLDDDERAILNIGRSDIHGGGGETNFVNEFGLYNLILSSRKPEAKKFKRWVTHEVLPSIRKTGSYSVATEKTIKQKQLTEPDRRLEEYKLLQARAPYMTDEEILEWADDPEIIIYKVNGGNWQVGFV